SLVRCCPLSRHIIIIVVATRHRTDASGQSCLWQVFISEKTSQVLIRRSYLFHHHFRIGGSKSLLVGVSKLRWHPGNRSIKYTLCSIRCYHGFHLRDHLNN